MRDGARLLHGALVVFPAVVAQQGGAASRQVASKRTSHRAQPTPARHVLDLFGMRPRPHTTKVIAGRKLSVCALWLMACATTATGRKQLTLMPSDQLDSMGEQAFQTMKQEQPVERESAMTDYVRCVTRRVAQEVEEGPGSWEVVVFDDPTANAFAVPGGNIGVHTGLLDVAQTPSQLATVLGHEIAHVTQDHANERMSQAFVAQGGLAAASIALDGEGGPKRDLVMAALGLGAQYGVLMPFSRTQESEADLVGLTYMARAGFDPRAAVDLWQNMAEAGGPSPPGFLSTHPSHGTRIEGLQEAMAEAIAIYEQAQREGKTPDCRMPSSASDAARPQPSDTATSYNEGASRRHLNFRRPGAGL